jgi:hypothetical protein
VKTIGRFLAFPFCVSSCLFVATSSSSAAPPAVTYLFPAGAQRGTTAEVTAAGTFDKWPASVWAGGKGVTVEPGKTKGKLLVKVAADAVPGVYWLRAHNADGASSLRPFVVGTLPEAAEKESNDEPQKPQVLAGSAVVNGQLSKSGDVDCFALTLKKGQTLVASLDASTTLKSPMDGVLQVVSADGFVLDQNNDYRSLDPQLAFTAPRDGTVVVRVFAFPATPDSSIRFSGAETYVYRLTLTTGGFAAFASPLAVSRGSNTGQVDVEGWNIPPEAKRLTLDLPPADQPFLTAFHPKLANTLRVRVEPHATYGLAPAKGALAPPFSATGRIDAPGGEVLFSVTGRKGRALTLQAESRTFGLAANPVIRVLDAEKKQLAKAEPPKLGGDTTLSFSPPADGAYTVAVGDLFAGGGPRHAFLLRVLTPEPDYDLTVAADRFAVPPGKSIDIPIKIARRGGFAGAVDVTAEGSPDGMKLAVKPPAGKADPTTVTVTLSGEKAGASGTFRLVGRVKDQPKLTRPARAPLPEFEDATADLWVTVSDTPVSAPPKKKKK